MRIRRLARTVGCVPLAGPVSVHDLGDGQPGPPIDRLSVHLRGRVEVQVSGVEEPPQGRRVRQGLFAASHDLLGERGHKAGQLPRHPRRDDPLLRVDPAARRRSRGAPMPLRRAMGGFAVRGHARRAASEEPWRRRARALLNLLARRGELQRHWRRLKCLHVLALFGHGVPPRPYGRHHHYDDRHRREKQPSELGEEDVVPDPDRRGERCGHQRAAVATHRSGGDTRQRHVARLDGAARKNR
mmetsp:Transcript_36660/g.105519  ORF Transcript_36660/g.105519 Transcript_36660/m.105519 type:complete len:242 (+) Transcript_36660:630-1355(+)